MNWINFLSCTGVCYALYYLLLIFQDQKLSRRLETGAEPVKLVFEQQEKPEVVSLQNVSPQIGNSSPATVGLGGVKMQDFFSMAKTEALQYTRPVSF